MEGHAGAMLFSQANHHWGVKLLTIMEGETTDILLDRLDIGLLGPYSPN